MSNILAKMQRLPFEIVEIDQPICTRSYGVSPCSAILGVTGSDKCFNTRQSCQDPMNFDGSGILTLKFCANRGVVPDDANYLPYLQSVSIGAAKINPGGGNTNMSSLGTRATISVTFSDHPHTDLFVDPYRSEREYNPYNRSTFWAKWRARNPYYMHRVIRHKSGFLNSDGYIDEETLVTRTFFITSFSGPSNGGSVTISGKDILTLMADEKSKAPFASNGKLSAPLDTVATSFTLSDVSFADEYPASGTIRINKECMDYTKVGAVFTVVRQQHGTLAEEHKLDDTVQLCLIFDSMQPHEIIYELCTTYVGIDPIYIDYANWVIEAGDYLPRLYSAIITSPEGVTTLLNEICEQMYVILFWDERAALLKLRAVRPAQNESITKLTDDNNFLEGSIEVSDRSDDLVTQVWVYYAIRNPVESITDPSNFGALDVIGDPLSEELNEVSKVRIIYSRWITGTGGAAAIELGQKILERFSSIPREAVFSVDAKDNHLWLADFISVETRNIVDFYGAKKLTQMQIISAQEQVQGAIFQYQAMEYLGSTYIKPDEYLVVISVNTNDINLWDVFQSQYDLTPVSGDVVRFIISSGVTIGGSLPDELTYDGDVKYVADQTTRLYSVATRTMPYITRRLISTPRDYDYSSGDIYLDPETDEELGLSACDIKEIPAGISCRTGIWPTGVILKMDIDEGARIVGHGGNGGVQMFEDPLGTFGSEWLPVRAGDGGSAIKVEFPITINNKGQIYGGAGGGAGSRVYSLSGPLVPYGWGNGFLGGGGGAGSTPGKFATSNIYNDSWVNGAPAAGWYPAPLTGTDGGIDDGGLGEGYKGIYWPGQFQDVVEYTVRSASGGVVGEDGEDGYWSTLVPPVVGRGFVGCAIQSGSELITWVQKGDVKGLEL